MNKPRIFLGSSCQQAKLLQAITRGLEDVADVEPWTTTFNPGRSTLDRLVELSQEVDFAAFVFAQDDWTTTESQSGEASPRDNLVFEAIETEGRRGPVEGLCAREGKSETEQERSNQEDAGRYVRRTTPESNCLTPSSSIQTVPLSPSTWTFPAPQTSGFT
jgi:hypothetical protein